MGTKAALRRAAASWSSARVCRRPGSSSSKEPEFFFVFFLFSALGSPSGERSLFPELSHAAATEGNSAGSALRLRTRGCESSTFFVGLAVLLALQPDVQLPAQLVAQRAARLSPPPASLNFLFRSTIFSDVPKTVSRS